MRHNTFRLACRLILCAGLAVAKPIASQMPPALGRLQITSTPARLGITINGARRPEVTPVTLAVLPRTYKVKVDGCAEQTVSVAAGATGAVDCTPGH